MKIVPDGSVPVVPDPAVSAVVEEEVHEQRVVTAPSDIDWDRWYRHNPKACAHNKDLSGHCARCGTCIDHAACAIMLDLERRRSTPQPSVGLLRMFRERINPWVGYLLGMIR